MSKSKINLEEISKDIDTVFKLIDKIDLSDLNDKNINNITKKANIVKKQLEKKYLNNLDTKK